MSQLKIKDGNTWLSVQTGGVGVPVGGNSGQVLAKSSNSDYATTWGDIIYVGDSQPTDPSVKMWLDTDEAGMSAVSSVNAKTGTVVLDADDVGATAWELLWENASPSSQFAPQTVPLDLSNYEFIAIEIEESDTAIVPVNSTTKTITMAVDDGPTVFFIAFRTANASSASIVFSNTRYIYRDGGNGISNGYVKPLKIYGIKGVITT